MKKKEGKERVSEMRGRKKVAEGRDSHEVAGTRRMASDATT
jgi:hypothetical protein